MEIVLAVLAMIILLFVARTISGFLDYLEEGGQHIEHIEKPLPHSLLIGDFVFTTDRLYRVIGWSHTGKISLSYWKDGIEKIAYFSPHELESIILCIVSRKMAQWQDVVDAYHQEYTVPSVEDLTKIANEKFRYLLHN